MAVKSKRTRKRLTKPQRAYGEGKTTLEVAQELEDKYHIVEKFLEMEEDRINELAGDVITDAFEDIEKFTRHKWKKRTKAMEGIESRFRANLVGRKYDGVLSGVPTMAAIRGVSHLNQHPYAKRASRPSFIDTGMYMRSFRAWLEDD
jgi:hypothetical protein